MKLFYYCFLILLFLGVVLLTRNQYSSYREQVFSQPQEFELTYIERMVIDLKIKIFSDSESLYKKGVYLYWKDDLADACKNLRQAVLQNYDPAIKNFTLVESFCKK